MIDKRKQGRRNKANGAIWERKVREDLESKGWIVCKWHNQVEFPEVTAKVHEGRTITEYGLKAIRFADGKLVPSKHKFNFFTKVMSLGSGFPDFIAYKPSCELDGKILGYNVIGVECKCGKYLDKEEKLKCSWLLSTNIFSSILIASKEKDGRKIKIKYQDVTEVIQ